MKDFIRREEEWGAVGVGSDGASSDVSEDEEEDKKGRCQRERRSHVRIYLPLK